MNRRVVTIRDVIRRIKKYWVYIVLFTLVITVLSGYLSIKLIEPTYESTAQILISGQLNEEKTNYNYSDITMFQSLLATYSEIVQSTDLLENAINESRLDLSVEEVSKALTVEAKERTQIITLSYISTSDKDGKIILDSIINELQKTSADLIPDGKISVISSPKIPEKPLPSNVKKIILMVFLITIVFSIAIVTIIEVMNNKISNTEDIEDIMGLIVIGELPEYGVKDIKKEKKMKGEANKCYIARRRQKADIQKV